MEKIKSKQRSRIKEPETIQEHLMNAIMDVRGVLMQISKLKLKIEEESRYDLDRGKMYCYQLKQDLQGIIEKLKEEGFK
ncbi:MAG: hypothetical protein GY853_16460 [PVC group bacterium]|nr:hypothetical protein [PVC group bacterium]